jgi:CPA1 family monovalent cation:H+ antiporter
MHEVELTLDLMVAVAILATLAGAMRLPYPIFLVLGGLGLAAIPAVPDVHLAPELVFLLFLPPLLYIAAFETALPDVRAKLQPILSLAVGLTLASTAAVAVVARWLLPEIGWPAAFALGAIVSPPDAVAATAVMRRLSVPRRIITLVEGESLFNDATALVTYRAAVVAMATATFSLPEIGLRFLLVSVGGVLVGLAVGALIARLRSHLSDPPVEITVSLLTPFAAYLAAEQLGVSGVISTVTTGLMMSRWSPGIMAPDTRVRARAIWDMVVFVLNGLVFILIGLQLSTILDAASGWSLASLVGLGLLISLTVIVVRMAWMFLAICSPLRPSRRAYWREAIVIGWTGMRGVVSMATALALPLTTTDRNVLIFVTFVVILVTLVGQGLSLPLVIRALGVADDGNEAEQELRARSVAVGAAVARIEELAGEWPSHLPLVDALRAQYGHRASHLGESLGGLDGNGHSTDEAEQELLEHRQIRRAVIDAERQAILDLRARGELDDQSWRRIERDLDLEELRMEA